VSSHQAIPGITTPSRRWFPILQIVGVVAGKLIRVPNFKTSYIPPVREAAKDTADEKNSVMPELLDLVVRKSLMIREDLQKLKIEAQSQYDAIVDPEHLPELTSLSDQLTRTLGQYAPGTSVSIDWSRGQEIAILMPEGRVKLVEDGYPAPVENTGHGLQHAFIITLLQHLVLVQAGADGENPAIAPEREQNIILESKSRNSTSTRTGSGISRRPWRNSAQEEYRKRPARSR